jgi:hypothetical protein
MVVFIEEHRVEPKSRKIHALGEVLSKETVRVLVGAPLPGALRIAEEDQDVGRNGEVLVASELGAPIPRQRPTKL